MAASLQNVPEGSLVHRFITAGKPGNCELCGKFVEKLEAHHISYSPEITINLCHLCHHKVHFWPGRLTPEENIKILKKRFGQKTAHEIVNKKLIGISALHKLVAPSRKSFILRERIKIEKAHEQDKKIVKRKVYKEVDLSFLKRIKVSKPKKAVK